METYLLEVGAKGRIELIDELAWPDMVDEANQAFGGPPGRAGLVAHVVGFRRNISDLTLDIVEIVAGVDQVMAHWTFTGTHDGPWLGRAPTGASIRGTVFSFFTLRDGRIARYRLWLAAAFPEIVIFDSATAGNERAPPIQSTTAAVISSRLVSLNTSWRASGWSATVTSATPAPR